MSSTGCPTLVPTIEAIAKKSSTGKVQFVLRSPDPAKELKLSAAQSRAIADDLEQLANKADLYPPSAGVCAGKSFKAMLEGMANALYEITVDVACSPHVVVDDDSPLLMPCGALGYSTPTNNAKINAERCWEKRGE